MIEGLNEEATASNPETSNNGRIRAFQNLDDIALHSSARVSPGDADSDPIPMHRLHGGRGREKHIPFQAFGPLVWKEKGVTIPMNAKASGD
jgi:hypothetical protein